MTTLREKLAEELTRHWPGMTPVDQAMDPIWELLQTEIGPVQEKLFNDLQITRTERDAALLREEALARTVAALQERLAVVEATSESEPA